jgi:hypothetical protein
MRRNFRSWEFAWQRSGVRIGWRRSVKSWGKIVLLGAAILVMAAGLVYWLAPGGDKVVERTKRELREAGFKVDVR